jgi:dolichol kinase
MRALHRVLIYALVTALIEGTSIIVLYSVGYPNNPSATGSLAFFIAYNLVLWFFIGGGSPETAPHGSFMYNPFFQLAAGVIGMFIIVSVIGEAIVWLTQEISKILSDQRKLS